MEFHELVERLNGLTERFYKLPKLKYLALSEPPFDISKPVIHDNKQDFLCEKRAVENILEAAVVIRELISAQVSKEDADQRKMARRLWTSIDEGARRDKKREIPAQIDAFLLASSIDQGLSFSFFALSREMERQFLNRKQELERQEAEYWSDAHRPPNHFARIIALRFAMAIYRGTGKLPTFGIAREGNHPSTEYGRALEEIFALLGIKANVKNAAVWAIEQAKVDVEKEPQITSPLAGLGAIRPEAMTTKQKIANMLETDKKVAKE